ncbi:MAG: PilZ domain-containing protein [Oleiphilus sp.]|nr:MAG: PilZ domain-containing protein [Oleiphilus sp.]
MRAYIRHPSDVPIEFTPLLERDMRMGPSESNLIQDVSLGGLSFGSKERLAVGTKVKIRIPVVNPPFEAEARVIWCLSRPDRYEAGIEFTSAEDAYTARMVEQICHIEHYRLWVKEVEGRDLDAEGAANEWIGKYAKDFPNIA